MLVSALDELHGGWILEVADILSTHIRMFLYGLETGLRNVAEQFLSYSMQEHSLLDDATVAQALRLEREQRKSEAELEAARKHAGGRRGNR